MKIVVIVNEIEYPSLFVYYQTIEPKKESETRRCYEECMRYKLNKKHHENKKLKILKHHENQEYKESNKFNANKRIQHLKTTLPYIFNIKV